MATVETSRGKVWVKLWDERHRNDTQLYRPSQIEFALKLIIDINDMVIIELIEKDHIFAYELSTQFV